MKRYSTILWILPLVMGILLARPQTTLCQATPPPYNTPGRSTKMACTYCHNMHGGDVVAEGDAVVEALCMSCHNGSYTDPVTGKTAAQVATHENSRTVYGTWRITCLGCHSPHYNAKADGSETDTTRCNTTTGCGNWMLIGDIVREANSTDGIARIRRPVIIDTLGNNNSGTRNPYTDDVMDGYYCSNTITIDTPTNSGAVRASNVVTITTIYSHHFSVGQSIRIGGIVDSSFNGTFTVASVPTAKSFTYSQTGANATSGNGIATSGIVDDPNCYQPDPPNANDQIRKVVFYDNNSPATAAVNQWAQPTIADPTTPGQKWYNGACNVCHTRTTHNRRDNSGGDRHNTDRACSDCHLHSNGWIK